LGVFIDSLWQYDKITLRLKFKKEMQIKEGQKSFEAECGSCGATGVYCGFAEPRESELYVWIAMVQEK